MTFIMSEVGVTGLWSFNAAEYLLIGTETKLYVYITHEPAFPSAIDKQGEVTFTIHKSPVHTRGKETNNLPRSTQTLVKLIITSRCILMYFSCYSKLLAGECFYHLRNNFNL